MISRFEYLYVKSQIKKIEDTIFDFEFKDKTFLAWNKFIHYNAQEKEEIEGEWETYFKQCNESYWGKVFWSLYNLFKMGQSVAVIQLAVQSAIVASSTENTRVRMPASENPTELREKMRPYYDLKSKLEQLQKIQEEYAPVYEKGAAAESNL